jgi:hypothetical protein
MTGDELLEQVTDLFVRRVDFLLFLLDTFIFQISSGKNHVHTEKTSMLSGGWSPASYRAGPGLIRSPAMWDWWWTQRQWGRFSSFPCQFSFHRLLHIHDIFL